MSEAAGRLESALRDVNAAASESRPPAWEHVLGALDATLHAASAETPSDPQYAPPSNPGAVAIRVLVVDADPQFRELVAEAGRHQLIEVAGAPAVQAALALARTTRFEGVVLDAHVGPAETFDLARQLRALPDYESLPIAFVSADTSIRTRIEAVHAGATLYLRKPLDLDTLATALRDLTCEVQDVRPRALVVDDDAAFGNSVADLLRSHGIDVRALTDPRATLNAVEYFRPDVLLLDAVMPVVGGLDLCRILRTTPAFRTLPILLLSSKMDVETRIQAFEAGADDCIAKPLVPQELLARVRGRIERQRLLRDRAERDSLTGLLLRGPVVETLRAKLADAQRKGSVLSVAIIDLDGFKIVNDTYGHLAGDRVLTTLGRLLATRFRGEDVRGRWGGEEFLVAFPGEPSEVAEGLVLRVLRELREIPFTGDRGEPFHITFSGGVATYPDAGLTVEALLQDRRPPPLPREAPREEPRRPRGRPPFPPPRAEPPLRPPRARNTRQIHRPRRPTLTRARRSELRSGWNRKELSRGALSQRGGGTAGSEARERDGWCLREGDERRRRRVVDAQRAGGSVGGNGVSAPRRSRCSSLLRGRTRGRAPAPDRPDAGRAPRGPRWPGCRSRRACPARGTSRSAPRRAPRSGSTRGASRAARGRSPARRGA